MTETTADSEFPAGDGSANGGAWRCTVFLRNAPQIDYVLRKIVEDIFYHALLRQFGDVESAAVCYNAWTQDKESPAAQEWVAATIEARIPVHHGLALANAPDVLCNGDNSASFEVIFSHDVD